MRQIPHHRFVFRQSFYTIRSLCSTCVVPNFCKCLTILQTRLSFAGFVFYFFGDILLNCYKYVLFECLSVCGIRNILLRENAHHTSIMIQPTLRKYCFNGPPESVPLDATSIEHDGIMLLDSFFHVVVFHGDTIASWVKQRLQDKKEYEHFRRLLQHPETDGRRLLENRFPCPRFVVCAQGSSQARLLTSKLNPSITHKDKGGVQEVVCD